jgi:hypothetical protein
VLCITPGRERLGGLDGEKSSSRPDESGSAG